MLAFDQLKQDQIVAISYAEGDGQRTAGLQVWDRPDTRLSELIEQLNAANAIADPAARERRSSRLAPPPRRRRAGCSSAKPPIAPRRSRWPTQPASPG